jgi:1,4-alpha-glucan branching enzyme
VILLIIVVAVLSSAATLLIEHRATGEITTPTPVAFVISAPDAKAVFVTGSFNNWNITDYLMTKQADGRWTATIPLAPGRYQYKFVVDGEWTTDPANPIKVPVPAPATGYNSVLEVRPQVPPANQ